MKNQCLLVYLLGLAASVQGCDASHGNRSTTAPVESPVTDGTYILHDRHDARLEYIFVVHDAQMFCQVAEFPGYKDRHFYLNSSVPPALFDQARKIAAQKSELAKLVPDSPWYSSTVVDSTKLMPSVFFKDENSKVAALMEDLKANRENAVKSLPEWVAHSPLICEQLALPAADPIH